MSKATIFVLMVLVVSFYSATCNPPLFPKKLWVYWHSPIEEAPFLVQLCVQKMRMACEQSNWTLYVLNETNLPELLPNYNEKFKPVKDNAKHPGWLASVADLIRLAVLQENGGVYLDISTVLFRGLGWLQKLQDFPYFLTNSQIDKGIYPQVLQSYIGYYGSSAQIRDPQKGITNLFPGYESWFFASKANASYISALRKRHAHHYVHTEEENRLEDIEKNYFLRYTQSDYLNNQKSAYEVLQEKQFELDKNLTLFGKRTNVNKHFKLVGFHAEYGPLAFYLKLEQDYIQLQFLLKFTNADRPFITDKLDRMLELAKTYPNIRDNFDRFMASNPSQDQCRNLKFVVEGSVFGDLVQNNRIALGKNVTTITVEQRNRWLAYCQQKYNTPTSPKFQLDDRIKKIIDEWILFYTGEYLTPEQNLQLREYLVWMGELYMKATAQTMGAFADAQEVYYWKKRYEQKQAANGVVVRDEQHPSTGKPLDDYSFWELLKLRLKLKILSNRVHLAFSFKIDNYFQLFAFVLSYIFLIITIKVKVLFFVGKWLYVAGCVLWVYFKGENRYSLAEVRDIAKQKVHEIIGKVKSVKADQVIKLVSWLVLFLVKKLATFLLAVVFVAYNALICYKYYAVVYFGEIFHQESTFLFYILLQVAFRKIFEKIGQDKWGFPGLTLGQMRRIFAPIYIFCIGASIVVMGEKVELRNLALSSSLCMILPVLIKEADLQIRKIAQLYNLKQLPSKLPNDHAKTAASIVFKAITNLSTSVEIFMIGFLVLNILLPNLRFLVSNNEIYTMTKLMYSMQNWNHFMFWLIAGLYLVEIFQRNKVIRRYISSSGRKSSHDNLTQIEDSDFTENISSIQSEKPISLDSTERSNPKPSSNNSASIYYQILTTLLLMVFYSLKLYLFYQMIYLPWQEIAIRNTWALFYQQSVVWLEYQKPLYVILTLMALFTMFFVSFELEKLLEETFMQQDSKSSQANSTSNQSRQENYIDISEQSQPSPSQKKQNIKIYCLLLVGLILFLSPRFNILPQIFTELTAVDTKDQTLKHNTELGLWQLMYDSLIYITYAFKIMRELLVGWGELRKEDVQKYVQVWKNGNDLGSFETGGEHVELEMQKSDHLMRSE